MAVDRYSRRWSSPPAGLDPTIEMTSPRAAAWKRALESRDTVDCSLSGDTVTCDVRTDRVAVALVDVEVQFD